MIIGGMAKPCMQARSAFLYIFLLLMTGTSPVAARCAIDGADNIPELNWHKRSDWLDVTSSIEPAAIPNDNLDDTASIQAALDILGERPGNRKVVYFPPGKYRISKTLTTTGKPGVLLVGHGRKSVIEWHGATAGVMFHSNGLHRTTYRGLTWDGRNIAAVGIDHRSEKRYETHILHEYSMFKNFTTAGIRVGKNQQLASAEIYYRQLVFENNQNGVLLMEWNDYNNVFDGIHFRDNDIAISAVKGNFVVRNSRFERSRKVDMLVSSHAYSVRRSVSIASNSFLRMVEGARAHSNVVLDNIVVENWKNPLGAVINGLRGPVLIFDSRFSNEDEIVPLAFDRHRGMRFTAVLANVESTGEPLYRDSSGASVHSVKRERHAPMVSGKSRFLKRNVPEPEHVLDVKTDCGAIANGRDNDTRAIQECIDRAGPGTEIYFPSGIYLINKTLELEKSRINLRGSGFHSILKWHGTPGGRLLQIDSPLKVSIQDLTLTGGPYTEKLSWSGNGAGSVRVHNVFGWYSEIGSPGAFVLRGSHPDAVFHGGLLDGTVLIDGTGASNILIGYSLSTSLQVAGAYEVDNYPGILSRVSCCEDWPLIITDNQSLVMTDWYNEQSKHLFRLSGNIEPDHKKGSVLLDLKKAESEEVPVFVINDYSGRVGLTGGFFGHSAHDERVIEPLIKGTSQPERVYLANMFRHNTPDVCNNGENCITLGNIVQSGNSRHIVPNKYEDSQSAMINAMLDGFRELGARDLALNYCDTAIQ